MEQNLRALLDYEQSKVDATNALVGNLTGYDCPICKNKGYVAFLKDGQELTKVCACMKKREVLKNLEKSGLGATISKYSFDNFIAAEEWQKYIKQRAIEYTEEPQGSFFIGGQVGCGKTHICTAIVRMLIAKNQSAHYMLWKDESTRLKACVNDAVEFQRLMRPLKETEVLYIDDFLKSKNITNGDINIAFELINYRYNANAKTIISTERSIAELIDIDEAVGSRIKEMARGYTLEVGMDKRKNYRLR